MFGIKRRFQRCKAWPPRFKETSVRAHQIWVPLENVRFLLLSTNVTQEWLQIDTDLLLIIATSADELSKGTNISDLGRPWTPKIGVLSEFLAILGCSAHLEWIFAEIKLMLSHVSWALAQISCSVSNRESGSCAKRCDWICCVIAWFFSVGNWHPSQQRS